MKHRDMDSSIHWTGDVNDDFTARWAGLMLRAEWMDDGLWWCVYDMHHDGIEVDSSKPHKGKEARNRAEHVARKYLGIVNTKK